MGDCGCDRCGVACGDGAAAGGGRSDRAAGGVRGGGGRGPQPCRWARSGSGAGGCGGDARRRREAIRDIAALADQPGLHGPVASPATAWRVLDAVDPARLAGLRLARAAAREGAWLARGEITGRQRPAARAAGRDLDYVVSDLDATLAEVHSEKEQAAGHFKGGYGYHPLLVFCDNTNEALAGLLRPGNAGSNTAADHIAVLDLALAQLPDAHRAKRILIRTDGAGFSHAFLDHLFEQDLEYSVGFAVTDDIRAAITQIPRWAWTPAVDGAGGWRDGADVAEVTGLLDLAGWPQAMRVIIRRERPHPGAQLDAFEERDGYRYQAMATNTGVWTELPAGTLSRRPCPRRGSRRRACERVSSRRAHAASPTTGCR